MGKILVRQDCVTCACGGTMATLAAYRDMSPQEQDDFRSELRNCPTCKKDDEHRRRFKQELRAIANDNIPG